MQAAGSVERARDALYAIPADMPRDEWVKAGMAAHAAGLDFDDFREWSAQADSFNERDAFDTWRSFKVGGGIGEGTLYKMAAQSGWRPPQGKGGRTDRLERHQPRFLGTGKGVGATEVWQRSLPATSAHPYIVRKSGLPDGLRVVPEGDRLQVMGVTMAGALVIPVSRANGSISSLQLVAAPESAAKLKAMGKPDKLNLPGCPLDGWHVVGSMSAATPVYLCEGIGQAWAANKATGSAAVVCFGWGRVRGVATELRKADKATRLVLVPDVGKEVQAEAIARELNVEVVTMPEGWPPNSDINDLAARDGMEAVKHLLLAPSKPAQRYQLLGRGDLAALPPLTWCVHGVLPRDGLASVYGPSASGKSFLALDLAAAIAAGLPWFNCKTVAAPVVYVALEGEAGMKLRAAAWEAHRGRVLPDGLSLVLQPFKLTEAQDIADLAAVVPSGAVVFLDTLNRAAPTSDENSSRDMGEILEAAKQLQRLTAGLVILVHHTGKDATKGLRGHSSLFAALDAALEVSREGDRREWRVAKSKDGQDGHARAFRLQVEALGAEDSGEAITSCVVVPDVGTEEVQRVKLPAGGNQRIALDVLRPMFKTGESGKPGLPPLARSVELETAINAVASRMTTDSHRRATRAREAINGLVGRGVLGCHDGRLWQCA